MIGEVTYTGYAAKTSSLTQVRRAYCRVRLLHPDADHVMVAYKSKKFDGCHDDGEYGASLRLLKLLDNRGSTDVAVFVARNSGGTLFDPKHFIHIEAVAKKALESLEESLARR